MKKSIEKLNYGPHEIEFDLTGSQLMVNATAMAKVAGKLVKDFTANKQTEEFINECCKDENFYELMGVQEGNSPLELETLTHEQREQCFIKMVHGGRKNGTWMHRVVALKFAAWLSPAFELWVFRTIDKLLFGEYEEIDRSIKRESSLDKRIETLRKKLESSEEYREIESLEFQKRQESNKRSKHIRMKIRGNDLFNQDSEEK